MSHIDTLRIYKDALAAGYSEDQALYQAKLITDNVMVTPDDLRAIRDDFYHALDKLIIKMDTNFKYVHTIGGAIFIAIVGNIVVELLR